MKQHVNGIVITMWIFGIGQVCMWVYCIYKSLLGQIPTDDSDGNNVSGWC